MTKKFEGFRSKPYKDRDTISVGYGFNIKNGDVPRDVVSGKREMSVGEADNLFDKKYLVAMETAKQFAGNSYDKLSDNKKAVLTDMAYNLGGKLFKFKDMQSAVLTSNDSGVTKEMGDSIWAKQVGKRASSLQNLWNQSN